MRQKRIAYKPYVTYKNEFRIYAEIVPIRMIQTTLSQQFYFNKMSKKKEKKNSAHLKTIIDETFEKNQFIFKINKYLFKFLYMKNRASHIKFPFRCVDMADIKAL